MMAPELMSAEEAAGIYLTNRAIELAAQIEAKREDAAYDRKCAERADADADALRLELQGITAIKAAILEEQS